MVGQRGDSETVRAWTKPVAARHLPWRGVAKGKHISVKYGNVRKGSQAASPASDAACPKSPPKPTLGGVSPIGGCRPRADIDASGPERQDSARTAHRNSEPRAPVFPRNLHTLCCCPEGSLRPVQRISAHLSDRRFCKAQKT